MIEMKQTFPQKSKTWDFIFVLRKILSWICLIGFIACPVVNYFTKGPLWCFVALWGMIIIYFEFLSPDIIESTMLSQIFRWSFYTLVMLTLIGWFLAPGWLYFILPIVGFSSLTVSALVLFLDSKKQKKQAMPFFWEIVLSLGSFIAIILNGYPLNWPLIVLGSLSALLLIIYLVAFGKEFLSELKKRFYING